MKYTIIYVFGPKRCQSKYDSNVQLDKDNHEWVKIGQTNIDNIDLVSNDIKKVIYQKAFERINTEARTGIPETCRLYDVFVFPANDKKVDDQIRNLLCNDIHTLENSKDNNKDIEEGDIKAGNEFVYGSSKSYIKHAVKAYISDVLNNATADMLPVIQQCNMFNTLEITDDNDDICDIDDTADHKRKSNIQFDMYLQIDDIVELWNGKQQITDKNGIVITAKYLGNNKFESYDGNPGTASGLASFYLQSMNIRAHRVRGSYHWKYNGTFLADL